MRARMRGAALPCTLVDLRAACSRHDRDARCAGMKTRCTSDLPAGRSAQRSGASHPNDKLRVVRALEVYEQTGQPLGAARAEHALGAGALPRPDVRDRSRARPPSPAGGSPHARDAGRRLRCRSGGLLDKHGRAVRPLQAVGYKQMVAHCLDGVPLDQTELAIERATLLYARRQRTWWKSDKSVFARADSRSAAGRRGRASIAAQLAR